jgi:hypothetical protein
MATLTEILVYALSMHDRPLDSRDPLLREIIGCLREGKVVRVDLNGEPVLVELVNDHVVVRRD